MTAVILPFKPRALLRGANEHERHRYARKLLNTAEGLVIEFGMCHAYHRADVYERAKEAFDAAAEAVAQLDVYLRTLCARVKPSQQWAFSKGEVAVSWQVAKAMIEELRAFLLRIDRNFTSLLKIRPFFRGEKVARHHAVARAANHNSLRGDGDVRRAERRAKRAVKKEGLPMGRPLSPKLVLRGDHYAFRCVVKDGGRPWIQLDPGLTLAEAQRKAMEIAIILRDGLPDGRMPVFNGAKKKIAHVETFEEWSARWVEHREAKGLVTTKDDVSRLKTHVFPTLGHKPMAKITTAQIEDLVAELDDKVRAGKLGWKTAENVWGVVTKAFADAHMAKERGLRVRADDPCEKVTGPDEGAEKVKTFLYPAEAHALLTCEAVPLVFRRAAALAIYLGLRSGELRSLTWGDVHFDQGNIHIHRGFNRKKHEAKGTKTDKGRSFGLEEAARPLLLALHAEAGGKGAVLRIPRFFNLAEDLREHLKTAGVTREDLFVTDATRKNLTFHDLRATCLTWMAVRGDDVFIIGARAGHSSPKQTQEYIRAAGILNRARFGETFEPIPACLLGGSDQGEGQNGAGDGEKPAENLGVSNGARTPESASEDTERPGENGSQRQDSTPSEGPSEAWSKGSDQNNAVEIALAEALTRATVAGAWEAVKAITDELAARRRENR